MTPATAPDAPLARRRRARLGRYSLWQLRDYAFNRGMPTLIVALLFSVLIVVMSDERSPTGAAMADMIHRYGSVAAARAAMRHDLSVAFISNFLGAYLFVGAMFATNGIVANDRKFGFYRFLFAKPVAPSAYYGAEFVVNALAFVALTAALALVYGAAVEPVLSPAFIVTVAAVYLCYAGLGFALSAISRWDWLSLVAVAAAADILWKFYGRSASPFAVLLRLLPPIHRTPEAYAAVAHGMPIPWQSVLWLAGYGAIAFIAGLAILRHRRLAFN
ncbi:MAG TPA: hypothetical protein VF034_03630 [Gemmatimonadaceae bacterium]